MCCIFVGHSQGGKIRYTILSSNSILLIGKASPEPADDPRVFLYNKGGTHGAALPKAVNQPTSPSPVMVE